MAKNKTNKTLSGGANLKHLYKLSCLIIILPILLAACGGAETPKATAIDPSVIYTAAVRTAEAKMTELAAITPTGSPTLAPSDTPIPHTPAAIQTNTPGAADAATDTGMATDTGPATPAVTLAASGDRADFVKDVTIPDGATVLPNQSFTKTWRLINTGATTWKTTYKLVFSDGTQMGTQTSTPVPVDVPPGKTVDISINMIAPSSEGSYTGFWVLRTPEGKSFGIGPNGDKPIYLQVSVSGNLPAGTPGNVSGTTVKSVSLTVDPNSFNGTCPARFFMYPKINMKTAAAVTYKLEIGGDKTLTPPDPETTNLPAGPTDINPYTLEVSKDFSGWVVLHITSPESIVSNQVFFEVTCR
jgi:hypothetical protein